MSLLKRISAILDSPSRRKGIDYTKAVSKEAVLGVMVLLYQCRNHNIGEWLQKVGEDFVLAHQAFIPYHSHCLENWRHPLSAFEAYLLNPNTNSVVFLDFLEVAFKNDRAPRDNDLIRAINRILIDKGCPYKLTEFAVSTTHDGPNYHTTVTAYPTIYLIQEAIIEAEAIMPALGLFANPDFSAPGDSFRKALQRHKDGDYAGCVTSCAAAVEGSVKVIAKKRRWSLKGSGVGSLAKSFVRKAKLPHKMQDIAALLAERRFNVGDAHGQEQVADITEAEARFLITLSAAFIVLVASELP